MIKRIPSLDEFINENKNVVAIKLTLTDIGLSKFMKILTFRDLLHRNQLKELKAGENILYVNHYVYGSLKRVVNYDPDNMSIEKINESRLCESNHNFSDVYHGTTKTMAEKILKRGYDMRKSGDKSGYGLPGMSTTIMLEIAKEHAEWAAEKYNDEPKIIMSWVTNLNLMPGKEFFELLYEFGMKKTLKQASKQYDGVVMFDYETGEGVEEYEILIFKSNKLKWVMYE